MKKCFTEDIELKNEIIECLRSNKELYGLPHCPCIVPELYCEDTICPCKDFRENVAVNEMCHCGLYKKLSD